MRGTEALQQRMERLGRGDSASTQARAEQGEAEWRSDWRSDERLESSKASQVSSSEQ